MNKYYEVKFRTPDGYYKRTYKARCEAEAIQKAEECNPVYYISHVRAREVTLTSPTSLRNYKIATAILFILVGLLAIEMFF